MRKHKGHHGGRYDDPHGVSANTLYSKKRYDTLSEEAETEGKTYTKEQFKKDEDAIADRFAAHRIAGGDYEFEMDEERRRNLEAPYAEGGYEDAARQERRGMME